MGWIQERQLCILFIKHAYKGKNPKQQSNWGKKQQKKKKKKKTTGLNAVICLGRSENGSRVSKVNTENMHLT